LVKSYNYDAIQLGEYWNCFYSRPRIYHHTISSTLLYGLREAIAILIDNGGLEASWQKHENVAKMFHNLVEKSGLSLFIESAKCRCPSVTSVKVPENVDPFKAVQFAMQNYNTEISGGLGPTVGKIFRIGLMGQHASEYHAQKIFKILREAVEVSRVVAKI
jgi:alanine-glyoxylate transaminase / serine-glyoxylate transaminase / serine-pyruvate transaminase